MFQKWQGLFIIVLLISATLGIRFYYSQSTGNAGLIDSDFKFTEANESLGITFQYELPKFDPILEGKERLFFSGSGVAVADINGDGWMDIFLPQARKGAKNHLYLNQEGKAFKEVAEEWGVAHTNQESANTSPLFFDFNNDGKPDLFIAATGCTYLFKNTGTGFKDISRSSGIRDCLNSVGALPLDFDNDGYLDLYVMRYWGPQNFFKLSTSFIWAENFFDAKNGGRNTLYRNRGDGTFEDVTVKFGGDDSHWTFDATFADLDGDGSQDIIIANDFGPDTLYSIRNGKLVNESHRLGSPDRRQGMSASLEDLDHSGKPHVYISNIYQKDYVQEANYLWKFDNSGKAIDKAESMKVDDCGWAWGSVFSDFDLDGQQDLYIANGMVSGPNKDKYGYNFTAATLMSVPTLYAGDVKNWPPIRDKSWSGHQVDCLFLNRGTRFENVSSALGPNEAWDGRAVALIDFDNNGSQDLVVTTLNEKAHLLKNEVNPGKNWISFKLIGTKSNRDGAGAKIAVRQGDKVWYRWATAGKTGFMATSDPRLHFGIPQEGKVNVEIQWPSGVIQKLENLPTGKTYEVIENQTS